MFGFFLYHTLPTIPWIHFCGTWRPTPQPGGEKKQKLEWRPPNVKSRFIGKDPDAAKH